MLCAPAVLRVSAFADSKAHQFGSTVEPVMVKTGAPRPGGEPQQGSNAVSPPPRPRGSAQMLIRALPRPLVGLSLAIVLMVAAACGSNPKVQKAPVAPAQSAPPVAPVQTPAPAPDPIAALIQTSQDHFAAGERELKLGHLERARDRVRSGRSMCSSSRHTAPGPTRGCGSISIAWSTASTLTRSRRSRRATASRKRRPSPPRSTRS